MLMALMASPPNSIALYVPPAKKDTLTLWCAPASPTDTDSLRCKIGGQHVLTTIIQLIRLLATHFLGLVGTQTGMQLQLALKVSGLSIEACKSSLPLKASRDEVKGCEHVRL